MRFCVSALCGTWAFVSEAESLTILGFVFGVMVKGDGHVDQNSVPNIKLS